MQLFPFDSFFVSLLNADDSSSTF